MLHHCVTKYGSKSIFLAARGKGDTRITELGEDLIAKEAKYHNSCRQDTKEEEQKSNRKKHDEAFQKLSLVLLVQRQVSCCRRNIRCHE